MVRAAGCCRVACDLRVVLANVIVNARPWDRKSPGRAFLVFSCERTRHTDAMTQDAQGMSAMRARTSWLMAQTGAQWILNTAQAARCCHLAGAKTTISLLIGGSQDVTVSWPGAGFPSDVYDVEPIALAAGIATIDVISQTATDVTVRVSAGLALGVGAAFLAHGHC